VGTYWQNLYSYGVELGSAQELTKMKVYGNTSAAFVTPTGWVDQADTFYVWTSLDGINWTQYPITYVAPFLHQATSNAAGGQWGYSITLTNTSGAPLTASWIKVRYKDTSGAALLTPSGDQIRIGEIELFGVNSSSSSSFSISSSSSSSSESESLSSSSKSSSSSTSTSLSSSSKSSSSKSSSSESFTEFLGGDVSPLASASVVNNAYGWIW
jgi:hypothetical protein